jgi:phosphoribosylformylglycinamidine synthase
VLFRSVVRIHGTQKALAISTDCTPRYCYADPYEGGKQAIAECYRNLTAVGATPLAVTNCLNFANPQRPEIMGQLVGCLEGMADACRALDFPIVSGNVSLYNESKATGGGSAILPTPAIGGIGLMQDWRKSATIAFKAEGETIWLLGGDGSELGQSVWLREIAGLESGPPPSVDLEAECRVGNRVRELVDSGVATAVHDISDGGLLVAVAEMALAGRIGAVLDSLDTAQAFGEDQGRYLFTTASDTSVPGAVAIGKTGGNQVAGVLLTELRAAHEGFFPMLMA